MELRFRAPEYRADDRFAESELSFSGSVEGGWRVERNGETCLELGAGYEPLSTIACGVCSTDLARRFLPFPLPQVTGHEILARDADGRRVVVEINASHAARGVDTTCPFCRGGLANHCPERLVLGIHDLPGGFGPRLLAPRRAILPVPDEIPDLTAVLVEPFAAALHVLDVVRPRDGEVVAVLGPRRLGLLVVAALAAARRAGGTDFEIVALSRHDSLNRLALELGATGARRVEGDGAELPSAFADVVVDTTGSVAGFELALRLARRELHVKSTNGQAAAGLRHLTELVVDELALERFDPAAPIAGEVAWLVDVVPAPPGSLAGVDAAALASELEGHSEGIPRADAVVVDRLARVDEAIRPFADRQSSLVAPRGRVLLHESAPRDGSPLVTALLDRGLRLSSSRCGDFRAALALLGSDPDLRRLGKRFVTHRLTPARMDEAFAVARSPACLKAVVEHGAVR